jgi:hypothetical protein
MPLLCLTYGDPCEGDTGDEMSPFSEGCAAKETNGLAESGSDPIDWRCD